LTVSLKLLRRSRLMCRDKLRLCERGSMHAYMLPR
jgi:hypothetical protein